jgi:hypothetical protein
VPPHRDAVDEAARLIYGDARILGLSRDLSRRRLTVKSWLNATRRMPVVELRNIRQLLIAHTARCNSQLRELELLIARREGEPPKARGFFVRRAEVAAGLRR